MSDEVIHLLFSANRWELAPLIIAKLEAGTNVILDRYIASGIGFSAAKGLSIDWCKSPDIGLPLPDVTFFLDIDPAKGEQREGFGEERYEITEFQAKVRDLFYEILNGKEWRNVQILEADRSMEVIAKEIADAVDAIEAPKEIAIFR